MEKLRRTERKALVFTESVFFQESQSTFAGRHYSTIQDDQLLSHAGQTASALGGEEGEYMWTEVIPGRLLRRQVGGDREWS